jgi:multisubunit Na+/H+ antiporter MnhE subunit
MTVRSLARHAAAWLGVCALLAPLWLLLVDMTESPELITGAVVVAIAAIGSELVRAHDVARARPVWRGLARAWKPILRAPADVGRVALAIAGRRRGGFYALPFRPGGDDPADVGRRALAEALGSFAPNTIVVGVDQEREHLLAHQLLPTRKPQDAIDPLGLR